MSDILQLPGAILCHGDRLYIKLCAVMMVCNALLLVYTGVVAPLQICLWSYDDPCNYFPTLFFDVFVDCFFLVVLTGSKNRKKASEPPTRTMILYDAD
jgi:hypothetical protein